MPVVGWVAGRAARRKRRPGRTVASISDAELPADLGWARSAPAIASAQARFASAVERAGEDLLPDSARTRHNSLIADWDGSDPPLGTDWLHDGEAGLNGEARPALRLTLLAALAPYRIDEGHVADFKRRHPRDHELVAAVAWGAHSAADRISSWLGQKRDRPLVTAEKD